MTHQQKKNSISGKTPSRSRSASIVTPTVVAQNNPKRNHSSSISSVASTESTNSDILNDLISEDSPYRPSSKGKIHLMDNADLEKQLILTAGGKREYVCGFVLKLLFLMFVVSGCSVLIFYAL